jgi:hypothetical protein
MNRSEHLKREAKKLRWFGELRAKRERYTAYVVARIGTRMDLTVNVLIDKGEREKKHEYQGGREQWLRYIAECVEEGGPNRIFQGAEQYECLRKRDQGAANRYACVSMPDRLPF